MRVSFRSEGGRSGRPTRRWLAVSTAGLALLITPLALAQGEGDVQGRAAAGEGEAILGGDRNPQGGDANRYEVETEIIANTGRDTYGTRQSNLGEGGGAIYGCRSTITSANVLDPEANTPCVRVNNLGGGLAFQFRSKGPLGGAIEVGEGGDGARPFVTNATGIATGLNADRVDGLNAEQIIAQAQGGGATGPAGPAGPQGPPAESISTFDTYFEVLDGDQSEVTLAENGPLRYFARCTVDDGGTDRIEVLVESTTGEAFEQDEGQLTASTPAVIYESIVGTTDESYDNDVDEGSTAAMEGTTGSYLAIDGETLGLGLNIFGHDCVVAGSAFSAEGDL